MVQTQSDHQLVETLGPRVARDRRRPHAHTNVIPPASNRCHTDDLAAFTDYVTNYDS
jgi:hypothetical protein